MKYISVSVAKATNPKLLKVLASLKKAKFKDIPKEYKAALVQRWGEHYNINGDEKELQSLKVLYGRVPQEEILELIKSYSFYKDDFDTFEDWLEWRKKSGYTDHGDSEWPAILWKYWEEPFEDGWHRLSYYLKKGLKTIPVVFCEEGFSVAERIGSD